MTPPLPDATVRTMARKMTFNTIIAWDGWLVAMAASLWLDGPLAITVDLFAWHIGTVAGVTAMLWPFYLIIMHERQTITAGASDAPQREYYTRPTRGN